MSVSVAVLSCARNKKDEPIFPFGRNVTSVCV